MLGKEDTKHAATTPSGMMLRSGLAVTTTYAAASIAYPLGEERRGGGRGSGWRGIALMYREHVGGAGCMAHASTATVLCC